MINKVDLIKISLIVLLMLILSTLMTMFSIKPLLDLNNNLYHTSSIYDNTSFNYLVPQPSDTQVDDFKNSSNFSKIVPYYMFKTEFSNGNKTYSYNLILIESFDEMSFTPYTTERALKKGNLEINSIAIDYTLSKELNVHLNDQIRLVLSATQYIEYKVDAIYEDNQTILDSAVVVLFDGAIKEYILTSRGENNPLTYQGAYLTAVDQTQAWQELSDYQPLASLRTRDEFSSDLAYQNYLDLFNSTDYTTQIYNKVSEAQLDSLEIQSLESSIKEQEVLIIIYIIGAFILLFILVFIVSFADLKYRKITLNMIKELSKIASLTIVGSAVFVSVIIIIDLFYGYSQNYTIFTYNSVYLSSHFLLFIILVAVIGVANITVNYFLIKPNSNNSAKNKRLIFDIKTGKFIETNESNLKVSDIIFIQKGEKITFYGQVVDGNGIIVDSSNQNTSLAINIGDKVEKGYVVKKGTIKIKVSKL